MSRDFNLLFTPCDAARCRYIHLVTHLHTHSSVINEQVQTLIVRRVHFYQSMTFLFSPSHRNATLDHFLLSSWLSTFYPFFLLLPVSLLPEWQDAHAIVLSWSWPHWLSNVKLIKGSLQGVFMPVRGIKCWWRSDRPLIMILLLVRMGEIMTLQARSAGTVEKHSPCLFLPLSLPAISNFHF